MLTSVWQEVRSAVRLLIRSAGFSGAAILLFALGVGANSAMFSLVDAVLLRPLPFGEPERLVTVSERRLESTNHVSGHEYVAWRDRSRTFAGLAIYGYRAANLTAGTEPQLVDAMAVSANFFDVLGLEPQRGRGFIAGEDGSPPANVAVLSDRLWRRQFGGAQDVLGRVVGLDDVPYTVVGVMPPRGDFDPDLWIPFDVPADAIKVGKHSSAVVGRLRAGVTIDAARADLDRIAVALEEEYPGFNVDHRVQVASLADETLGSARLPLYVLSGAVLFILLIACVNVAHLVLTRAAARRHELAVRTALGASRARIALQLVSESTILALVGGGVGVLLAAWLVDLLPRIGAVTLPRLAEAKIDGRVLAVTLALAALTGVLTGLVPAVRAARLAPGDVAGMAGRSTRSVGRMGGAILVVQVALTLVLLVGAGLLVRTFAGLIAVDPGFRPDGALAAELVLPPGPFAEPQRQVQALSEILERVERIPGVVAAGTTTRLPLTPCCDFHPITIENAPPPAQGEERIASFSLVGGDYFRAMGMRIRAGRSFTPGDARVALPLLRYFEQQPYPPLYEQPQAPPVAIINEAMARRYWPDSEPVGRRFRILFSPWITVVGVVADVRQTGLAVPAEPQMYVPVSQEPRREATLVVRTDAGDPLNHAGAVRSAVRSVDATIPIRRIATLDAVVGESLGRTRFYAGLLGGFALLSLVLAVAGIYSIVSYTVRLRAREIGIRCALGAQPADLLRLVLGRAVSLTLCGIALGVAAALALTRLLATLLFGVEADDPVTFSLVAIGLFGAALLASYRPTARALRAAPSVTLKDSSDRR